MAVEPQIIDDVVTGLPAKGIRARFVRVVISPQDKDQATAQLRGLAEQLLGDYDRLRILAYLDRDHVKWRGYIARVEHGKGRAPLVFYDNDLNLRWQIYQTYGPTEG